MFDQNQPNQNYGGNVAPQAPAAPPFPNSPMPSQVAQPAPAFSAPPSPAQPPVDDIFGGTPEIRTSSLGYGQNQPMQQYSGQYAQMPGAVSYADLMGGRSFNFKKLLAIVAIVAILLAAVGAGIWVYLYLQSQVGVMGGKEEQNNEAANISETEENSTTSAATSTEVIEAIPNIPTTTAPVATTEKDSDGDGFIVAEERELKTNPNSADSDSDGLSDWVEIKIY